MKLLKNKRLSAPLTVDVNITGRCNLQCPFCSASPSNMPPTKDNELDLKVLESIFAELEEMGVFVVRLAGGEPLIHSNFDEVIKMSKRFNFEKMILTNGIAINRKKSRLLKECGFNHLGISLDGNDEELYEKHRGVKNTFKRLINNLKILREEEISYSAMTVVSSYNIDKMIDIIKFAQSTGFTSIKFLILAKVGKGKENDDFYPTFSKWEENFLELNDFVKENRDKIIPVSVLTPHEDETPYELYVPLNRNNRLEDLKNVWGIDYVKRGEKVGCSAGKTQFTVFENGKVFGCDLMKDNNLWCAGNIHEQKLKDIWDNSPIFNKLEKMSVADLNGPCLSCELEICGGGCRASASSCGNDICDSDMNCAYLESKKCL